MSSQPPFRTEELPFAAYLHASHRLRFLGCEPVGETGRVSFVFADPVNEGEKLIVEFESGAECPAAAFYDSIRHLRRVMDRTGSKEQNESPRR